MVSGEAVRCVRVDGGKRASRGGSRGKGGRRRGEPCVHGGESDWSGASVRVGKLYLLRLDLLQLYLLWLYLQTLVGSVSSVGGSSSFIVPLSMQPCRSITWEGW